MIFLRPAQNFEQVFSWCARRRTFSNRCKSGVRPGSGKDIAEGKDVHQGMKQLMAGGGVALIGITLVPLLSGLFG